MSPRPAGLTMISVEAISLEEKAVIFQESAAVLPAELTEILQAPHATVLEVGIVGQHGGEVDAVVFRGFDAGQALESGTGGDQLLERGLGEAELVGTGDGELLEELDPVLILHRFDFRQVEVAIHRQDDLIGEMRGGIARPAIGIVGEDFVNDDRFKIGTGIAVQAVDYPSLMRGMWVSVWPWSRSFSW